MKVKYMLIVLATSLLYACTPSTENTEKYSVNEPIFMDATEFRNSIAITQDIHPITSYGKISFYKGYLFVSEPQKGIHIINNTDAKNPQVVGYIELLGNADIAIKNDMLYADSYIDLVWFDITNPATPVFVGRLENVFEQALPPLEDPSFGIDGLMVWDRPSDKVIVGWTIASRTVKISNSIFSGFPWWPSSDPTPIMAEKSSNGINGSMSRFSLHDDYLYSVINNNMSIINLSGATPVKAVDNIYIGWDVETIFYYKNNMFMGTPTGLLIYSVANPTQPVFKSSIQHVLGCDPVVVENDIAYVTIHSGNLCGQNNNELIVIDVKDVENPKQLVSYTMTKPKGLGIDNGTLFICDDGLKIYKADKPQTIMANELAHYTGIDGYDVIPFENTLMMIASDGIYQYDYSDLNNIHQISFLPMTNDKE
jgi:hypothetical protein